MKLALLSGDLMLGSRIEGAARKLGLSMVTLGSQEAVASAADDLGILLIDLRLPNLQVGSLVKELRESSNAAVRIVACGPHVHEGKLAAAREAGCDAVVTRGQIDRDAEAIFERLLSD